MPSERKSSVHEALELTTMELDDYQLVRLIRRKLCCFQCSTFVEAPYYLKRCSHVYCGACIEDVKKRSCFPCGDNTNSMNDIACSRLLSNIAQSFGEFYFGLEKHLAGSQSTTIISHNHSREQSAIEGRDKNLQSLEIMDIIGLTTTSVQPENHRQTVKIKCKSFSNKQEDSGAIENGSNTFFDVNWDEESANQVITSEFTGSKIPDETLEMHKTINKQDTIFDNKEQLHPDSLQMTPLPTNSAFSVGSCPLTQQNSYIRLQQEIKKSKAALENLLTDANSDKIQVLGSLGSPLASLSSTITQQNTINSIEAEILQTKGALQTLLQESRISGPDLDFQWKYRGIAVVAEFSNLSNLLLFEEACKKGWISCTNRPIDDGQVPKYFVSEAVVEEQDGHLLVRRTMQYMKCLLSGFQIVDFRWLKDSVSEGHMQNPQDYEIGGTNQDKVLGSPQKIRCITVQPSALLRDYVFVVLNDAASPQIKHIDIEELIILAGGGITSPLALTEFTEKIIIVLSLRLKHKGLQKQVASGLSSSVISVSWLFDFVCDLQEPNNWKDYFICELVR